MKVLKFGGTSVGSVASIKSLQRIVESEAKKNPVIVVVSALGGVTDQLIKVSELAGAGEDGWKEEFAAMTDRHHQMIDTIITNPKDREDTFMYVDALLEQLRSLYYGVYLIHDLSPKTLDAIVSYGERLSSGIVAALLRGSKLFDAREFIKTERIAGKHQLSVRMTYALVQAAFADLPRISVVPGFIASDKESGETTTLGRGGSDYTASIVAAALDAQMLEIWTDVDGFMTADPHIIKNAYTIPELSYLEALELSNFGAKVIYPPTIYPVCVKNIPIRVKNTFNPKNPGSVIREKVQGDNKPVKGISSISGATLITIAGMSMVGVIGVNRRIFAALAQNGISAFMVSQASSENSSSIGVRNEDADRAAEVLNAEFATEIRHGEILPMRLERNLATIAVVGENMKHTPGIAGKLFGALGRSGISVIACAQGASETNISFAVEERFLRKAMNVLHDTFFLSEYKELNLFICGIGTVGGMLLEQLKAQKQSLEENSRLRLNVVGIARSNRAIFDRNGIDLEHYQELLNNAPASTPASLLENIIKMNIFNPVFVDCTASADVSTLYQSLLEHNVNVVTANKIAASGAYSSYARLKATALNKGVKFLFETNVGAGLPIICTIKDLRNSGDKILKIEAVLSGTLNFIFNEISAEVPFSEAVRRAKEQGYSEPDPRIDLSGTDVVRKLVILARESGYVVEQSDVEKNLFVPDEYFQGSVEEFWRKLPELDEGFEKQRLRLAAEGKCWRFVATMDAGKCSVGLREIEGDHSFYVLEGSNNIVLLTTERYKQYPMLIQGYGAGAGVTAAGVFANIMSIANI